MFSWLGRRAFSCFSPSNYHYAPLNNKDAAHDDDDPLLWSKPLEKHSHGEFSFAVVQANAILEDHSQVQTSSQTTLVGVYDGHGGPQASTYISHHLFHHLLRFAGQNGGMSEDVLRSAFSETEKGFLAVVRKVYARRPLIASIGSCCLVGVIWKKTLLVANLGDSRAVIGHLDESSNKIIAEQVTKDDNASMEDVRKELQKLHPQDSEIFVMKQGGWRIIQVSRSIGDAYLKVPEFGLDPYLPQPLREPLLTADPMVITRDLSLNDKFIIFASDGLWEYMSNEEAVRIVNGNQREGIARRLVISALRKAAEMKQVPYGEIKKLDQGMRRHVHDDITVIVIFILDDDADPSAPQLSIRGYLDSVRSSSNFEFDFESELIGEGN